MLRLAHRDLKAARSMLDDNAFDESIWGFQIQQATEKALKAWISALDHEYPRSHDLALLCRVIADCGDDASTYQGLENFTPFGARLRYDDELEPLNLDRDHWNLRYGDLLAHVAALIRSRNPPLDGQGGKAKRLRHVNPWSSPMPLPSNRA